MKRRATSQSVRHEVENKGKRRRKSRVDYNMVDRISALPNDILVSLVSRLPLKEAAATSILSRRWKNVGLSTMTLRFDAVNFSNENNIHFFWSQPKEIKEWESCQYVNWVNSVVQQHRGEHIKEFRVSFFLDSRFRSSIDEWIQFTMEKSVEMLELDFYPENFARFQDYTLPHKLLGFCIPSRYNTGFKSLRVLQIRHVSVTGEILEYFLSNCPYLERLSVTSSKDLVNLRVVGPSVALKYLVIQACLDLRTIEICGVNIVSFVYCGYDSINLRISNVPLLSEVTVSKQCWRKDFIKDVFTQLSCCLSNIEILKLQIQGSVYNENHVLPLLANLKHLELLVASNYRRALHQLNYFLKASPNLQRLVLKLQLFQGGPSSTQIGEIEKAADCPHHHLKVVEIVGYRAHISGVEHVMHLVKNVVALEKIVIDPVRNWRYPRGLDRSDEEVDEEAKARDHAKQYFQVKIPSTVEFVCL